MSGMMGLNIGIRALKAQQRALDVTGHNIANANTEGYSRQRVEMAATLPHTMPSLNDLKQAGQVGTGVAVTNILRLREEFLDERIRDTSSALGQWSQRANSLEDIEGILAEPAQEGLRSALDRFWESLQELNNDPKNGAVRAAVRETAASLTDVFNAMHSRLDEYQKSLDVDITGKVSEINNIAQRIADLNDVIAKVEGKGEHPNDLMDQRDLLIDKLSKIVNIDVTYDVQGRANIALGGSALVMGKDSFSLTYKEDPTKNGLVTVKWDKTNNPLNVKSGELAGLFEARDIVVKEYMDELDGLARNLIGEFNKVHQKGFGLNNSTGIQFFTGSGAKDINVSQDIWDPTNGLNNIAAALEIDKSDDNRNALRLANVMKNGILNGKQTSMNDYWGGIIAKVGVDAQRANRLEESNASIQHQLEQQRSSTSGVSLDEEMGNLIMYQHAYNAAAKLISTQAEMLDTLVNGLIK